MTFDSRHWMQGACTLHGVPQVPCPACLAERDPSLECVLSRGEAEEIIWGFADLGGFIPADFRDFHFADVRVGAGGVGFW